MIDAKKLRLHVDDVLVAGGMERSRRKWVLQSEEATWTATIDKVPRWERYRLDFDLTLAAIPVVQGENYPAVSLAQEDFGQLGDVDVHDLHLASNLDEPMADSERVARVREVAEQMCSYAVAHLTLEDNVKAFRSGDYNGSFVYVKARKLFTNWPG